MRNLNEHREHLDIFIKLIRENGLVVSVKKIQNFQTKIIFSGYEIYHVTITPIQRLIESAEKFPNEMKDKQELQIFLDVSIM